MKETKRKALESAGWKIGDAADFLETSDKAKKEISQWIFIKNQTYTTDLQE